MFFQPNSAYLTTRRVTEGKYHWTLVITDSNIQGTRHHWTGIRSSTGREAYKQEYVGPLYTLSDEMPPLLGYFRIVGWRPPPQYLLEEVCRGVFAESYPTAMANRMNNISCRTWMFEVLRLLQEEGYIEQSVNMASLEPKIVSRSNELAKTDLSLRGEHAKESTIEDV